MYDVTKSDGLKAVLGAVKVTLHVSLHVMPVIHVNVQGVSTEDELNYTGSMSDEKLWVLC